MALLVSFIGWIVMRYSASYLDGEERHGRFTGAMAGVLASVLLLVLAGNLFQFALAWVLASICLHQLLLFYPDRLMAQRAARKKALMARLGDAALLGAAALIAVSFETFDIAKISEAARNSDGSTALTLAAALLPWPRS